MKYLLIIFLLGFNTVVMAQKEGVLELSKDLFAEFKMGFDLSETMKELENYPYDSLVAELDNDQKKLAFWLNIYNVFGQIQLTNNPDQYKYRGKFFRDKMVKVAGLKISLNKIEHGILRASQWAYGFGYLSNPFPKKMEKELRLDKRDYRIHFALNCGAKSCPPIYVYESEKINEQLDLATRSFLEMEVKKDTASDLIWVPRTLKWFRGDFGGKKGIYQMLRKYELIKENESPKLKYKKYDWKLHLKNYKN